MPRSSMSKALEFYDMGFVPEPGDDNIANFLYACERKLGMIEDVRADPAGYLERSYGFSSDLSLVDDETADAAHRIFEKRTGMRPPHPLLVSKKDFRKVEYRIGVSHPLVKPFRSALAGWYAAGTILEVEDRNSDNKVSVCFPFIMGKQDQVPITCAHELSHAVRHDVREYVRRDIGPASVRPIRHLKRRYLNAECEYVAYNVDSEKDEYKERSLGEAMDMLLFATAAIAGGMLALHPSLIHNIPKLMLESLGYGSISGALTLADERFTCWYVERFRNSAMDEGLDPDYILTKASVLELGTKDVTGRIQDKEGLRWDLLREKFGISV